MGSSTSGSVFSEAYYNNTHDNSNFIFEYKLPYFFIPNVFQATTYSTHSCPRTFLIFVTQFTPLNYCCVCYFIKYMYLLCKGQQI